MPSWPLGPADRCLAGQVGGPHGADGRVVDRAGRAAGPGRWWPCRACRTRGQTFLIARPVKAGDHRADSAQCATRVNAPADLPERAAPQPRRPGCRPARPGCSQRQARRMFTEQQPRGGSRFPSPARVFRSAPRRPGAEATMHQAGKPRSAARYRCAAPPPRARRCPANPDPPRPAAAEIPPAGTEPSRASPS